MLRLPKREVEIPVYIPVFNEGKPREQRWSGDVAYLRGVMALKGHDVFKIEILHALSKIRELADIAENPDILRGYQAGIKVLKELLSLHIQAKSRIADILAENQRRKEQEEIEEDGTPSR